MLDASVTHVGVACGRYVELEARAALHMKATLVQQAARSSYRQVEARLGGRLSRQDLAIEQACPDSWPPNAEVPSRAWVAPRTASFVCSTLCLPALLPQRRQARAQMTWAIAFYARTWVLGGAPRSLPCSGGHVCCGHLCGLGSIKLALCVLWFDLGCLLALLHLLLLDACVSAKAALEKQVRHFAAAQ